MAHEYRSANGLLVHRYEVLGTALVMYETYESTHWRERGGYEHSSLHHVDDVLHGRVGTRNLPADLEVLPPSSRERLIAVGDWHAAQYAEAYAAIVTAFPEALAGRFDDGRIILRHAEVA